MTGTSLFTKVFPHAADESLMTPPNRRGNHEDRGEERPGIVRAGAAAFVVGTVITAIVTIILESLTIAERMKIPVTLRDGLAQADAGRAAGSRRNR